MVRCCSIFIALWLQASPVIRWMAGEFSAGNLSAIVIRIGGVSAGLLGGAQAMSGATTWVASTNPPAGPVNSAFNYRLQTAGNHSAGSWSSSTLPPGLVIAGSSGQYFVQGTPTSAGTSTVTLTGWEFSNKSGPSVTGTAKFAFTNGIAPAITITPGTQRRLPGTNATFSVTATGTAPLRYQWRKDATALIGQTNSTLTFTNLVGTSAGSIVVVVTNGSGSITSAAVNLLIAGKPVLTNTAFGSAARLTFSAETGVVYRVEGSQGADFASVATMTTVAPMLDGTITITNSLPPGTNTFFRLRLLSP